MAAALQVDRAFAKSLLERNKAKSILKTSINQYSTTCHRCGGLLVQDCDWETGSRCIQCGDVIDSVILKNRSESHHVQSRIIKTDTGTTDPQSAAYRSLPIKAHAHDIKITHVR